MANTREDFKTLAQKRLETVKVLIANQEWGIAAYLMGFVLECVLKAAACKALNLTSYPEVGILKNKKIIDYFRTHSFDMLLIVSGTNDIFDLSGEGANSWSGFTQEYTKIGEWVNIRYNVINQFDETLVKNLYNLLTGSPNGIIPLIEAKQRW